MEPERSQLTEFTPSSEERKLTESFPVMAAILQKTMTASGAETTVQPDGEHWFHTEEEPAYFHKFEKTVILN